MADSKIEWTDRSDWNPIRGCTRVSPGCGGPGDHGGCYAEAIAARFSGPGQPFHTYAERTAKGPRWTGKVALQEDRLALPLRWRKPARIFASSTSDIFHEALSDADIDRIFAVMALCPQHTFQVLTKRAARMRAYLTDPTWPHRVSDIVNAWPPEKIGYGNEFAADFALSFGTLPPRNVWLGVSVEDQQRADERIPDLLATPAAVRFLSCEPLLGPVDLTRVQRFPKGVADKEWINAIAGRVWTEQYGLPNPDPQWDYPGRPFSDGKSGLDWVIAGGESGPNARPMHPDWARSLRDQCQAAGVPFFFKQWGEWGPDTGPDEDHDRDGFLRDRVMEGAGPCAVRVGNDWQVFSNGYAVPLDLCRGHGEFTYRLGKRHNGRLLDGREWSEMPA